MKKENSNKKVNGPTAGNSGTNYPASLPHKKMKLNTDAMMKVPGQSNRQTHFENQHAIRSKKLKKVDHE